MESTAHISHELRKSQEHCSLYLQKAVILGQTPPMAEPRTARAKARAQIMEEILDIGRAHLARDGAPALSLRAVARDLGMVSSAIYRYVPNRDALITLLIVEAYNSLGIAVENAEGAPARTDVAGRFLATCHAVRAWALANPHEYALIYGSPVPGYIAPADTIGPASRVPAVLIGILVDLNSDPRHTSGPRSVNSLVGSSIRPVVEFAGTNLPDDLILKGLLAWSTLFGAVSLELFGHLHNVVAASPRARKAYFEHQMRNIAAELGLTRDGNEPEAAHR